jgi:hypothetical protein
LLGRASNKEKLLSGVMIKKVFLYKRKTHRNAGFFQITLLLVSLFLGGHPARAQDELKVVTSPGNKWLHFTDAPNALYHHLAAEAYELLDERRNKISKLNSLDNWQQRQQRLKETLSNTVGPFPEKTPLNAKILKVVKKDFYNVEHIVYESQPDFYVTSSLFIPHSLKKRSRAPVVIYCSGHAQAGYRSKVYQHAILNLVKKGFIVFAFDPVGQGERLEYYDQELGKSQTGGPTAEHSYPGSQAFINGSSQARYMVWDGIRAVDYLLTRREVDPARIGITGRSGGGTQSAYIAAFDERIKAAAPECYLTGFTRLLQSIGPQDAEQNLFRGIARGIDHADLLAVRAPKPALMITTTRDMFSIQGARETAKEIGLIYDAYGNNENFHMVEDDAPHASTEKNREAMYAFFQKHLELPGSAEDEEVEVLSDAEIQVTETGQVSTSHGGETVFTLNRKEAEKLVSQLEESRTNLDRHLPAVIASAKELSGYREPAETPSPVFTGRIQANSYVIEKYFIKGEGDYIIPYLLMVPETPTDKFMIYLHPSGKSAEAMAGGHIEWFVRKGFTVLAPDLLGIGEMGAGDFRGDAFIGGKSHNIWYSSMLIGRSIVGIHAGDIARLIQAVNRTKIYAVATREMASVLLHSAAFNPAIAHVALIEPYSSYRSIAMNRFYHSGFIHSVVPGALRAYDLPDLAASLAPRPLLIMNVTNGAGKPPDSKTLTEDFSVVHAAYQSNEAADRFKTIENASPQTIYDFFSR